MIFWRLCHDVKDIKEALASLPEHTEIGLAEDGTLYVNGCRREYFHARGCSFKTEVDGVKYIVDGTGDYDAFSDACAELEFSGTLTNVKNKKVYSFSFEYSHIDAESDIDRLESDLIDEDEDEDEYAELTEIARGILSEYEFQYIEWRSEWKKLPVYFF